MSQFLPGNIPKTASDSLQQIIARDPALPLQQDEQQLINRLLGNPGALPAAFWAAVIDRVVVDAPSQIPVSQLQGFSRFTATSSAVVTNETTSSTTYTNLATAGPTISGLSPGEFLFLYGARIHRTAGSGLNAALMAPSLNAATPTDVEAAVFLGDDEASVAMVLQKTLTATSNEVKMQYRVVAGTYQFQGRWFTALRIGN